MVASEAATVRARLPVHQLGPRHHRPQRHPAGDSFGQRHHIRFQAEVFAREHFAGPAHPALDLIRHQQDPVFVRQSPQLVEKFSRRHHITAFPLYRLHENRGYVFRWHSGAEQFGFNRLHALYGAGIGRLPIGATITIGVRHVVRARHHRKESLLLYAFTRGQRQRSHGSSMKRAHERNELASPGVVAGQFDRRLDRFGP
jgi:hypothetical protein